MKKVLVRMIEDCDGSDRDHTGAALPVITYKKGEEYEVGQSLAKTFEKMGVIEALEGEEKDETGIESGDQSTEDQGKSEKAEERPEEPVAEPKEPVQEPEPKPAEPEEVKPEPVAEEKAEEPVAEPEAPVEVEEPKPERPKLYELNMTEIRAFLKRHFPEIPENEYDSLNRKGLDAFAEKVFDERGL